MSFEAPAQNESLSTSSGGVAVQELPIPPEDVRALEALDTGVMSPVDKVPTVEELQRWYSLESRESGDVSPKVEDLQAQWEDARERLAQDTQDFEKQAGERVEALETRLAEYQQEHPGVKIEEVEAEEVLEPGEMEAMKSEIEAAEKSGINWKHVAVGLLVVGGVAAGLYFGAGFLGYGPAMGRLMNLALDYASEGLTYISSGVHAIGEGVASVITNVKSWKVWTEISSWLSGNTAEYLEKGLKELPIPDPTPLPGNPFDYRFGKLPPLQ